MSDEKKTVPALLVTVTVEEVDSNSIQSFEGDRGGPSKYNSKAYVTGYERIFGKKTEVGQA